MVLNSTGFAGYQNMILGYASLIKLIIKVLMFIEPKIRVTENKSSKPREVTYVQVW